MSFALEMGLPHDPPGSARSLFSMVSFTFFFKDDFLSHCFSNLMHRGITGEPVQIQILVQEDWVGLRFHISNKLLVM